MKKLLQINVTANWGSTGKIAELIGKLAIDNGWESWIAYGRQKGKGEPISDSNLIRICSNADIFSHAIMTRIFDNHGLNSTKATNRLIDEIEKIKPDIIHLHNIHGYYINYKILFSYISQRNIPVVWTLHDCWTFTGHCPYFEFIKCNRWQSQCFSCPQKRGYPASLVFDRSKKNYIDKKQHFTSSKNITFTPVSKWLQSKLNDSFFKDYPSEVIHNGIDLKVFKHNSDARRVIDEKYGTEGKTILIGVASVWDKRKGLNDFYRLRDLLDETYAIILIGLTSDQLKSTPKDIIGISRTENVGQLVDFYSSADAFVNPTYEDTYPTTNLEALACGTPVITYDTGGSPESLNDDIGRVVEQGNLELLASTIKGMSKKDMETTKRCMDWAQQNFDAKKNYLKYIDLYNHILKS